MLRAGAFAFLLLSSFACPSAPSTLLSEKPPVTPADVLFVVDNSNSMAEEQQALARGFASFLDAADADLHVMVVSTDLRSPGGEQEGTKLHQYASEFPNELIGFDTSDCRAVQPFIDHGCARGPDPARRILSSDVLSRDEMIAAFAANVALGTCGTGNEEGIEAALVAIRQRTGCNSGFLREEADLVIIFVSTEEDAGTSEVTRTLSEMIAAKQPGKLRLGAIIGAIGGVPSRCGLGVGSSCGSICDSPPPSGSGAPCRSATMCPPDEFCDRLGSCENRELQFWLLCFSCTAYNTPDCCSATEGVRYVDLLRAFEQRETGSTTSCQKSAVCHVESICQPDFDAAMRRLARRLIAGVVD